MRQHKPWLLPIPNRSTSTLKLIGRELYRTKKLFELSLRHAAGRHEKCEVYDLVLPKDFSLLSGFMQKGLNYEGNCPLTQILVKKGVGI